MVPPNIDYIRRGPDKWEDIRRFPIAKTSVQILDIMRENFAAFGNSGALGLSAPIRGSQEKRINKRFANSRRNTLLRYSEAYLPVISRIEKARQSERFARLGEKREGIRVILEKSGLARSEAHVFTDRINVPDKKGQRLGEIASL